jgi:hypothetical protein
MKRNKLKPKRLPKKERAKGALTSPEMLGILDHARAARVSIDRQRLAERED